MRSSPDTNSVFCPDPGVVTMWSDIGCPWATLAVHTLRTTAARAGRTLLIDHRAFPLEMYNRRPTPRPVIDAEVVAITGLVPETGLRMWDPDPYSYPVSTLPALEAVQVAKDDQVGGLAVSTAIDAALRDAMYVQQRCISILTEVEEIAMGIEGLDADAFIDAFRDGAGRRAVMEQWHHSKVDNIQGSPQIFTADGTALHNPGVDYAWTQPPQDGGVPRLHGYDTAWAHGLHDSLTIE